MKLNINNRALVLWWNDRDGNGVIVDQNNNEYYTDISVTPGRINLKRGTYVDFRVNEKIKEMRCAIVTDIYVAEGDFV